MRTSRGTGAGDVKNSAFLLGIGAVAGALTVGFLAESAEPYFPERLQGQVLDCQEGPQYAPYRVAVLDEFEADWFAGELRQLKERPLYPASGADRTLRFTWLRSFHAQVTVRVETQADGSLKLFARRGPARVEEEGCDQGGLGCVVTRVLTAVEAARLEDARRLALDAPPQVCGGGLDGARWIVEATEGGQYEFRQRFSPRSGPVRDLGLTMLDLTGWEFAEVY